MLSYIPVLISVIVHGEINLFSFMFLLYFPSTSQLEVICDHCQCKQEICLWDKEAPTGMVFNK